MKSFFRILYSSLIVWSLPLLMTAKPDPKNQLPNPLEGITSVPQLVGQVVQAMLGLVGILSLVFFIIGGFYFLTSGGNSEKVKKGIDTLVWAVIGIIVAFGSYAILSYVLASIGAK
ncbi:MAG: Uncharacterized protein G01um101418_311 [Parcubacteria group bacterium Gr01-1014_18]|nr:MAG: Uncharacterized protein Greene041636_313 [Parcubacteria group bacterium Greene0416_36]TSC81171.1 MAG: Uncharacterized protein G01um101418_311 [Parcubacteria group bacterium Gr01-1014_18]TSC99168.1 MAG: Uncharacterized protein Greene101420_313 [Parcubacteria group bacterium Greene1014_20]TSD07474.1 MAG: Uncharacterized protein Greene07142_173 [Parcubacteria group bacterium Greene0714_2]